MLRVVADLVATTLEQMLARLGLLLFLNRISGQLSKSVGGQDLCIFFSKQIQCNNRVAQYDKHFLGHKKLLMIAREEINTAAESPKSEHGGFLRPDASQSDAIHENPISAPQAHANEIRHAGVHLFRVATRLW